MPRTNENGARVVLLGASNVERCISTALRWAQAVTAGPADFYLACGHGRSYGMESSVLGRALPGIAECGIWSALAERPAEQTYALLTDVGNDLLYGAPVDRIVGWVEECVTRLRAMNARVVLVGLPTEALAALPRWRFALLSRVLFPFNTARFDETLASAAALDAALRALADRHGATWRVPRGAWYGFDPIHIRRRVWDAAWKNFFEPWADAATTRAEVQDATLRRWLRLKQLRPEHYRVWGRERHRPQPAGKLEDGSRVWVY